MTAMATSAAPTMRLTSDSEMSLSRKCTEEQPLAGLPSSSTPQRDNESKRRRLTSDSSGGLLLRGQGEASASGASPMEGSVLAQEVEDVLRGHLYSWAQKLVQLQPKVHMSDQLIECGLCLFKYLRQLQVAACIEGRFPQDYLGSEQLLLHDLIACWWVALKHCSVRTAVPNRTLMTRATGATPALLSDRELAALVGMDWDVNAVLRLNGFAQ